MFALIDCNNFYASCERVFRPDLNEKPIVVLSNNDGCVIARSKEAKELDIPMGAPYFKYDALFKLHHVNVFSANFTLYGDMSNRIMTILSEYSPEMEIYSIDECFLKLMGYDEYINLQEYCNEIKNKVVKLTGVPISIGIAKTKALSKLANRIAKKYPERTNGSYVIDNTQNQIKALKWLKIEDVWGIGRQHSTRLKKQNVFVAFDFVKLDEKWIRKNMGVVGLRLKKELEGISTLDLEHIQPKKNIAVTRSFEKNYFEFNELKERISTFASSCSEKLRKQNSCCNSIMVFIRTNRHRSDLPQYGRNIVLNLPFPTNSSIELVRFAILGLKVIFKHGFAYKKAGVIVQDFTPENVMQVSLFENRDQRHIPLMRTIDSLNAQYGQQKIRLACQDQKRVWKMKQQNLSPQYTTKLTDIITINV